MVTDAAYPRCLDLASAHYENFPVASRLLPAAARPHIAAVYAFARVADDFADEGDRPVAERLALLDDWSHRLQAAAAGTPLPGAGDAGTIFVALADTMRRYQLEVTLFDDLLSAFRQDVTVTRYETWRDLLDYCRRSANPVGRLVLRLFGWRDAAARRLVGRRVHGAAADELLAGPRRSTGRDGRAVRAAGNRAPRRRRRGGPARRGV